MVRQCQVCKNSSYWESNLSFYRFPRNPMLKKQWFLLLGFDKNKIVPASAVICMYHFTNNDFNTKPSGVRVLKAGALPLPFHPVASHNTSSDSTVTDECIKISKEFDQFDSPPRKSSDSTVTDECNGISKEFDQFDSPPRKSSDSTVTDECIEISKEFDQFDSPPRKSSDSTVTDECIEVSKEFDQFDSPPRKSSDSTVTDECIEISKEFDQFDSPPRKRFRREETVSPANIDPVTTSIVHGTLAENVRNESSDLMLQTSSSAILTVSGGTYLGVDVPSTSETEKLMRSAKGNSNIKQTYSQSDAEPGPSKKALVSVSKKRKICYLGDLMSDDFSSPTKSKRHFNLAKETIQKQRRKIKNLQSTAKRLKAKITSLNALLELLLLNYI